MRAFAALFEQLDQTTSTQVKLAALASYFGAAPPEDAAWALFFLTGRRLNRLLPAASLHEWAAEAAGLPPWLFDECVSAVGDLAEAIALTLEPAGAPAAPLPLHAWIEQRLLTLRELPPAGQRQALRAWWAGLDRAGLLVLNKLVTGGFRVGVAHTLVVRGLAQAAGLEPATIAHRLMGAWEPTPELFRRLAQPGGTDADRSRPYPFQLASPLDRPVEQLGAREAWLAEWKWDGIRAQLVRRDGECWLWSRGEELVTARFPEIVQAAARLEDGLVLDGEILAWREGRPLPFAVLQHRIGRRRLTTAVLQHAPAAFVAFDLLERGGADVRDRPLAERRAALELALAQASPRLAISAAVVTSDWSALAAEREGSRARGVEGLLLKRLDAPYTGGRRRGDWWKWKIEPYAVDAVLIYAQAGHGRRASLYTDYTFAVWRDGELVPIAKAYSGLSDEEIRRLDGWIRNHTRERHGPVRAVEPTQVFEIAFEAIARSRRHRSGIAVRFPRIARWRHDKRPEDADTLERLEALLTTPA